MDRYLAQLPFSEIDPGNPVNFNPAFTDLASIISTLIPLIFGFAGFITLTMTLLAGFRLLVSGGDVKKTKIARDQLLQGMIGFLVVFASYWIVQIVEVIFGVTIF